MFKVLVVEDDAALRQMFCRVLSHNGYEPLEAESAADALELMDHEFFDIIITDVMMPGMDGFEFVKITARKWLYSSYSCDHSKGSICRQTNRIFRRGR